MFSNCHRLRLKPELHWKRREERVELAELAPASLLEQRGPARRLELEHWTYSRLAVVVYPQERLAASLQTRV
jgi:hypothetical protein